MEITDLYNHVNDSLRLFTKYYSDNIKTNNTPDNYYTDHVVLFVDDKKYILGFPYNQTNTINILFKECFFNIINMNDYYMIHCNGNNISKSFNLYPDNSIKKYNEIINMNYVATLYSQIHLLSKEEKILIEKKKELEKEESVIINDSTKIDNPLILDFNLRKEDFEKNNNLEQLRLNIEKLKDNVRQIRSRPNYSSQHINANLQDFINIFSSFYTASSTNNFKIERSSLDLRFYPTEWK